MKQKDKIKIMFMVFSMVYCAIMILISMGQSVYSLKLILSVIIIYEIVSFEGIFLFIVGGLHIIFQFLILMGIIYFLSLYSEDNDL